MLADHANKYGLERAYPAMEHLGRIAFPLFALVVAANLRWNTADPQRYFMRLAVWGMASQAVYTWATARTDLNILITLALGVLLVRTVERLRERWSGGSAMWLAIVLAATLACDYPLTGALLVLLLHEWFTRPALPTASLVIVAVAVLNVSLVFAPAALASLIVAALIASWEPRAPRRTRYWFYPFYPAHFAAIRLLA